MKTNLIVRTVMAISVLLLGTLILLGQTPEKKKLEFGAVEREAINTYYKHLLGTLAPASIDRKGFPPEIEKALSPGNKVPGQYEKQLELLPKELESKLPTPPAGYLRYKLGRHVLLVQRSDLAIADIVRDAGWK